MGTPNFSDKTIWTGDNLDILRGMNSECVDLIYLDPPFNSNRELRGSHRQRGGGGSVQGHVDAVRLGRGVDGAHRGRAAGGVRTCSRLGEADARQGDAVVPLTMMAVRLMEMRRVLKPTGSLYLHCDPTASHYLKLLMDAVFGAGNFRNEITSGNAPLDAQRRSSELRSCWSMSMTCCCSMRKATNSTWQLASTQHMISIMWQGHTVDRRLTGTFAVR